VMASTKESVRSREIADESRKKSVKQRIKQRHALFCQICDGSGNSSLRSASLVTLGLIRKNTQSPERIGFILSYVKKTCCAVISNR